MASEIPIHLQDIYSAQYKFLVQQKDSMLRSHVRTEYFNGERKAFSYTGKQVATEITERAGVTQHVDVSMPKRWVTPRRFHIPNIIDEFDDEQLGTLGKPDNAFVTTQAYAMKRKQDALIISAAVGTAYSGKAGTTPVTLPSAQQVAVNYGGSNIGLTLAKLIQAKYIMDDAMVPEEGRVIAYSAKQLADLLNNVSEIKSSDYNNVKALVEGQVNYFLGFKFVRVEKDAFPYVLATDVRTIVAFHMDGIALGVNSDIRSTIDRIPDRNNAIQVRSTMNMDAARLEESCVVSIACDESP